MTIPTTTTRPAPANPAPSFAERLSPAQAASFAGARMSLDFLQRSAPQVSIASFASSGIQPFQFPTVIMPAIPKTTVAPATPQALFDRLVATARAASGTGTLTQAQLTAVVDHYNRVMAASRTAQQQMAVSIIQKMTA